MRKKSKSTKDVAQPTSKQDKEVLMGSAQLLSKDRSSFKGYGVIK